MQPALVCVCAQSWHGGSNGVSSPGQTMGNWIPAAATKETLSPGTLYLVGLTPGLLEAGTDADPTPRTRCHPSIVLTGLHVFANNLIDFCNIHMLVLVLEKLKRRLVGQRAEASGGLTPHTHSHCLTDYHGFFPEEAESLRLLKIYCFNFPASMSRRHQIAGHKPLSRWEQTFPKPAHTANTDKHNTLHAGTENSLCAHEEDIHLEQLLVCSFP